MKHGKILGICGIAVALCLSAGTLLVPKGAAPLETCRASSEATANTSPAAAETDLVIFPVRGSSMVSRAQSMPPRTEYSP